MSGDPEQEYFADGLTEDIITALSAWQTFPVIARNSTFARPHETATVSPAVAISSVGRPRSSRLNAA